MEYRVFYRAPLEKDATWWRCLAVFDSDNRALALEHYGTMIEEYGKEKVVFAEVPEMTEAGSPILTRPQDKILSLPPGSCPWP